MSRQFGYLSTDPTLFDLALQTVGKSLSTVEDSAFDGWGVGYYQNDRALVGKRPVSMQGRVNVAELAVDVQSHCVLAHLRRGKYGAASPENTQPFRFRNWVFSHVGDATPGGQTAEALYGKLPDFLQRNVRGESDSEPSLHFFFDFLRKRAHLEHAIVPVDALVESMRETVDRVRETSREAGIEEAPTLDLLYVTGRVLVAVNSSPSALAYHSVEGVKRTEKPLFAGHEPRGTDFPHFKAVFVTFDPYGVDGDWKRLETPSILVIDERLTPHVFPLNP